MAPWPIAISVSTRQQQSKPDHRKAAMSAPARDQARAQARHGMAPAGVAGGERHGAVAVLSGGIAASG